MGANVLSPALCSRRNARSCCNDTPIRYQQCESTAQRRRTSPPASGWQAGEAAWWLRPPPPPALARTTSPTICWHTAAARMVGARRAALPRMPARAARNAPGRALVAAVPGHMASLCVDLAVAQHHQHHVRGHAQRQEFRPARRRCRRRPSPARMAPYLGRWGSQVGPEHPPSPILGTGGAKYGGANMLMVGAKMLSASMV